VRLFIDGFEFYVYDYDKCGTIAEALRDIIKEGQSVTYNDWTSKDWRWYSNYLE
jgi:hypothetical protein